LVRTRAEEAIRLLAGQHRVNPFARCLDDLLITQHVAEVAVTFEPVWQFFPAELPLPFRRRPGAVFKLAPFGNLLEMTDHAIGLQLKLRAQPPFGFDAAERTLHERPDDQRRA